ncbi:MAG: hypothetical protein IPJ82_23010 [Lewinellaceae bacterium]|nr:hypothetical protein [Lewinellaceae bacterium]
MEEDTMLLIFSDLKQAGQIYWMKPGQVHSWYFAPETDGYVLNFNEVFITSICHNPHFIYDFPMFNGIAAAEQLAPETFKNIRLLLEAIHAEYVQQGKEYKNDLIRAMLVQLLIRIARVVSKPAQEGLSANNHAWLRSFNKLIEEHYRKRRRPKDYADMMHITPNYLNSICNITTGNLPAN